MSNEINWALFERTVKAIESHPENWDQADWHCGTSHCFAGFAHIIDLQDRGKLAACLTEVRADYSDDLCETEILGEFSQEIATRALGLNDAQWIWLFAPDRTIDDFHECLKRRAVAIYGLDGKTVWP